MKIAYCLATYNSEKCLNACIESIMEQEGIEGIDKLIFICDDCSSDSTVDIINEYGIEYLSTTHQSGGYCAIAKNISINAALEHDPDYIVLLDSDDYLDPQYTIQSLRSIGDASWITTYGQVLDSDTVIKPIQNLSVEDMRYSNGLTSWALIRSEVIRDIGGYDENLLYEDYDLWIRLLKKGYHYKVIEEPLYYYRVHEKSKTSTIDTSLALNQIRKKHYD